MAHARWTALAICLGLLALASGALAQGQPLRLFDVPPDVCPQCPAHGYDQVLLHGGQIVEAVVLAENPRFTVLEKFSEFRAVDHDRIEQVARSPQTIRTPGYDDQILLKSGLVVAGRIVKEYEATGYFEMQIPGLGAHFFVDKPMINLIFKGGRQYYSAFETAGNR